MKRLTVLFLAVFCLAALPWRGSPPGLEVIDLRGQVDEDMAHKFVDDLARLNAAGQPIIPVYIDTMGGGVYDMLNMIDAMHASKSKVMTICRGICFSAGAFLLAHGSVGYRWSTPRSTVLLHHISGPGTSPDALAERNRLEASVLTDLARHIGLPPRTYLDLVNSLGGDAIMVLSAEQAKDAKLIDQIGVPTFRAWIQIVP